LIQEARLTHEPSDTSGKPGKEKHIRETGQGLTDYLDHLMNIEGPQAVIDFLKNLNIRYHADSRFFGKRAFNPRIHDPTRPDQKPDWILEVIARENLEETIYEFVDRHQKSVLRRHAHKGNINGLNNFLDVFIETNKLLYSYYKKGVLKPLWAMQRINRNISIFTQGDEEVAWVADGFIAKMFELHLGDLDLLRDTFKEAKIPGHLRAGLLFAQIIRWEDDSQKKSTPSSFLGRFLEKIESSLSPLGSSKIGAEDVGAALDEYQILDKAEKKQWLSFL